MLSIGFKKIFLKNLQILQYIKNVVMIDKIKTSISARFTLNQTVHIF